MTEPEPPQSQPSLSATAWALLGMLSYETELSGYDIRKWIGWSMRYYYGSPAFSQIYSELKKARKRWGCSPHESTAPAPPVTVASTRSPKPAWRPSPAGPAKPPVEPPSLKHPAILRVTLGHLSDPASLKQMLQDHIAYIDDMQRDAAKEARWAAADPSWAYAKKIALEWAERYYASERELTLRLIKDLDEAEAKFPKVGEGAKIPWPDPAYWYEIERKADAEES